MPVSDNNFIVRFNDFHLGQSPAAHLDSLTEIGLGGHYATALNVDLFTPKILTQGPGLADLTNGNQNSVIYEVIYFVMDRPAADNSSYAVGVTKLFQLSSTTITSSASFPRIITNASREGGSCVEFQNRVYYFWNRAADGNIGQLTLPSTFDDDWGATVPTNYAVLYNVIHPSAKKEDILVFGNGRYFGTYVSATNIIDTDKLDFGINTEVADVAFHANQWWIAVNQGITAGVNRTESSLYLYDGAALSSVLFDEVGVGVHRIGWIMPLNGVVYVCWRDITNSINYVGYVSGRSLKTLGAFTGLLPTYNQKTVRNNFIVFVSSGLLFAVGSVGPDFPISLFQFADGGYDTVGAIGAPFGTVLSTSWDGSSNYRVAYLVARDTNSTWRSIVVPTINGRMRGYIDYIVVRTNNKASGARCDLIVEADQATLSSATQQITGTDTLYHIFDTFGFENPISDFRIFLNFANGSTSNRVDIKEILVLGHYVES